MNDTPTLKDTDEYDTVAHRKQRIDTLRDEAIEMANQTRVMLARNEIRSRRSGVDDESTVTLDTADRVARSLFRQQTEAFVRESFQVINTQEAQERLSRDYMHGVKIDTVTSPCPDGLAEEHEKTIEDRYYSPNDTHTPLTNPAKFRPVIETRLKNHANGEHDETTEIVGLRPFVDTPSPFEVKHNMPPLYNGTEIAFNPRTYIDVCELSWTGIFNAIEWTTTALDEVGIGFEFESRDNGWQDHVSDSGDAPDI